MIRVHLKPELPSVLCVCVCVCVCVRSGEFSVHQMCSLHSLTKHLKSLLVV